MRVHEEHTERLTYISFTMMLEKRIAEILENVEPPQLREAMEFGLCNGKMVRPILTMLACSAVGGKHASTIDAAAAVEILHCSSLLHDDIMDDSPIRRGKPTVHTKYGVPMAILAGDTMVALAFQVMGDLQGVNAKRVNTVFTESFRHVCEGQGFDLCLTGATTSERVLSKVVEKKTAKLFQAASEMGALIGTRNEVYIGAMRTFGYHLGMAFQIQDDVLDVVGDEQIMGKRARVDEKNGKRTVVSLADNYSVNRHAVCDAGSSSAQLLGEHTKEACAALSVLPANPACEMLFGLAQSLMKRER